MDMIVKMLPGIALLLVLVGVVQYLKAMQKKGRGAVHRYERRNALMTPAELKFFRALEAAVGSQYRVFSKVRLADIVQPVKTGDNRSWLCFWGR